MIRVLGIDATHQLCPPMGWLNGFQCHYDDINDAAISYIQQHPIVQVQGSRIGGIISGDGMQKNNPNEKGIEIKNSVDFGTICDRTFVDAVLTGDASKIRSPYADAYKSNAFVLACNKSMETGMPVKVEY